MNQATEQLIERAGGPLHFRLLMMPLVVAALAARAGLKDARERQSSFVWTALTNPAGRWRTLRSGLRDVGRVFIVAIVLDVAYQYMVLREFHIVQLLIVAVTCAIVPYVLIRDPVARCTRGLYRDAVGRSDELPCHPNQTINEITDPFQDENSTNTPRGCDRAGPAVTGLWRFQIPSSDIPGTRRSRCVRGRR